MGKSDWEFEFLGLSITKNSSTDIIKELEAKGFEKTGELTLRGKYCDEPCTITIENFNNSIAELKIEFDKIQYTKFQEIKDAFRLKYKNMKNLYITSFGSLTNGTRIHISFDLAIIKFTNYDVKDLIQKEKNKIILEKYEL